MYECLCLPAFMRSEAAVEQERREAAALDAFKSLFVHHDKLPAKLVLEKLRTFEPYLHDRQFRMKLGEFKLDSRFERLSAYNTPNGVHCLVVDRLEQLVETSERKYPALHSYLGGAFKRQLELCERLFREAIEDFQEESAPKWRLVVDFSNEASQCGVSSRDVAGNRTHMNQALCRIIDGRLGARQGEVAVKAAYRLAKDLVDACTSLSLNIGFNLRKAAAHPEIAKHLEIRDSLRHLSVCDQVKQMDFGQTIEGVMKDHQANSDGARDWAARARAELDRS